MDLHAAIRKRLNSYYSTPRGAYSHNFLLAGHDEMKAALLAVLELHKPEPYPLGPLGSLCAVCYEPGAYSAEAIDYPCPTVRAIAEQLGVEVSA